MGYIYILRLCAERATSDMGLEPEASGAVRMRMELAERIVRTAFINTSTSDLSGRRGDRNPFFYIRGHQR